MKRKKNPKLQLNQAWELGKVSGAHRDDCSAEVVEDLYELAFPHSTFKHTSDNQRQKQSKYG